MPSLFKKKPKQVPQPVVEEPKIDIDEMTAKYNRQIASLNTDIAKLRQQAKAAINANNQLLAKNYVTQMKQKEVMLKNVNNQLTLIENKKMQVKQVEMTRQNVNLMKQLNKQVGDVDKLTDEFQDVMAESNEHNMQIRQMQEMLNNATDAMLALNDDGTNLDDELALLQEEVNQEVLQQLPNLPDTAPGTTQTTQQASKSVAKPTLDDLL